MANFQDKNMDTDGFRFSVWRDEEWYLEPTRCTNLERMILHFLSVVVLDGVWVLALRTADGPFRRGRRRPEHRRRAGACRLAKSGGRVRETQAVLVATNLPSPLQSAPAVDRCPVTEKPKQNAMIMSCQTPITGNLAPGCVADEAVTQRQPSSVSSLLFHVKFEEWY